MPRCACRDLADIDADLQTAESQLKHAEIGRDDLVKRHSKLKVCLGVTCLLCFLTGSAEACGCCNFSCVLQWHAVARSQCPALWLLSVFWRPGHETRHSQIKGWGGLIVRVHTHTDECFSCARGSCTHHCGPCACLHPHSPTSVMTVSGCSSPLLLTSAWTFTTNVPMW